jgi:hypothetical protein
MEPFYWLMPIRDGMQPGLKCLAPFNKTIRIPRRPDRRCQTLWKNPLVGLTCQDFTHSFSQPFHRAALKQLAFQLLVHAEEIPGRSLQPGIELVPNRRIAAGERQLLQEKQELLKQDRNLSLKRLRRESLRSSLSVWAAGQ